jgi:hypothetical protein
VGINNNFPSAALDVVGDVKTDASLFLENPGDNSQIRGSNFLVRTVSGDMQQYDIGISKYGPINYAELEFIDLSTDGLQDYDTKISTSDYVVSVQGYAFYKPGAGHVGGVMPHSLISPDNIEGHQIYAYANPVTNTWFLRSFVNNSQFQVKIGQNYVNTSIDMTLNLMIYRKGFIAKEQSPIAIDMGNSETITAPLPPGF